jgi:hypothetical protein
MSLQLFFSFVYYSYSPKRLRSYFLLLMHVALNIFLTSSRLFTGLFNGELKSITAYLRSPNIIPVLKPVSLS